MKRKVLICVLDWGLGHATRSLAVIKELEFNRFEVIIASSGDALTLLKLELPHHTFYELPGYNVLYDKSSFEWGIILQSGKILKTIEREHSRVEEIVRQEEIEYIISDNRYGCYCEGVTNIFLSHHLNILLSGFWKTIGPLLNAFHTRLIGNYQEVWVPDFADHLLSGNLSRIQFPNMKFVGPLSTMRAEQNGLPTKRDIIAVLSGPEPARTRFSEHLFHQLRNHGGKFLLAEGKPGRPEGSDPARVNFMNRSELYQAIRESAIVIARSGYSTIMDMCALGGRCIFVPTPGQTEQIYLAQHMNSMGIAPCHQQDNFDLERALADIPHYKGFGGLVKNGDDLLRHAIVNLTAK